MQILPFLGGTDFVSIRRTCKWIKEVADVLEISSRPALWRWYVLSDFPRPCVEHLAPWLYVENRQDPFIWKMLYVRLNKISSLLGVPLKFTHLLFDSEDVHLTKDVTFNDRYLFITEKTNRLKMIGLDNKLWKWPVRLCNNGEATEGVSSRKLYSQPVSEESEKSGEVAIIMTKVQEAIKSASTMLRQCYNWRGNVCISTWTNNTIFYQPQYSLEHNVIYVVLVPSTWTNNIIFYQPQYSLEHSVIYVCRNSDTEGDCPQEIKLKTAVSGFKSLSFNDKWIVGVCDNRTACIIAYTSTEDPVDVFKHTLRAEATKIKILGSFVLILYDDGVLETAHIITNQANQMGFTNWQGLTAQTETCYPGYFNAVKDFVIRGQLFSAILANGEVYLSHFETLDHESLERNLHSPYKISISCETACLTRLTVDVEDVIKLAVVEILGHLQIAKVHVIYVDTNR